jgi:predicted AAA+ superfamily ATPase
MDRDIYKKQILKDLDKKMVFVVGPRQVGKTWIAKDILEMFTDSVYLNFDVTSHRKVIKDESWNSNVSLIVFDEIHKMKGWKNYLKGVYDGKKLGTKILVTGSARLDAHKKMGDSLAGRYFTHHLMPFSVDEIRSSGLSYAFERLIERGGFPEPFLSGDVIDANRWRSAYEETLIREDILSLASVDNMTAMRHLFDLLKDKVGSPFSASSLAGDLGISPMTVKRYISLFESLYLVFTIRPYTNKIARSILKEPKIYFYDTGMVSNNSGAQLENAVAVELYTRVLRNGDMTGACGKLAYLKTKEGKEVDFAIIDNNNNLIEIIEVKVGDNSVSPQLKYFSEKYKVKGTQIVQHLKIERMDGERISITEPGRYF